MSDIENIKNNLDGIPHIRYLNLDNRVDRKEYMENQFSILEISNYVRVSADRYSPHNFNEWKKCLITEKIKNKISYISILINQLQSIIDWYNDSISETCLILEDDLSFLTSKYWNFNWKYFESHLPCNWDCVQLHIIGETYIPMGLTKRTRNNHAATCYLINRRYAEKLIQMHYFDGKFKLYDNYGYKNWPVYHHQSPDFVPYEIGITYSFPLFITNFTFSSDCYGGNINGMAKKSDVIVSNWWREKSHEYSVEELFSLDVGNRKKLIIPVSYNDDDTGKSFGFGHSQHN
jgi:hypothetical protein